MQAGINLEKRRRECLLSQEIGFTELVNQIHFLDSPQEELRNLIRQLDYAVLEAYSWNKDGPDGAAINLDHGFYTLPHLPRKDNIRFTISPVAWNQVWERLYALNQKRAKDEAIE
ncbi:MAG TPA: hypothetical protein DCE41_08895 [Cytophagales bacterium]|nr:hypothetical protein [Cytophagales bacterium]